MNGGKLLRKKGEKVPAQKKIVSLYQPHTDSIIKGCLEGAGRLVARLFSLNSHNTLLPGKVMVNADTISALSGGYKRTSHGNEARFWTGTS